MVYGQRQLSEPSKPPLTCVSGTRIRLRDQQPSPHPLPPSHVFICLTVHFDQLPYLSVSRPTRETGSIISTVDFTVTLLISL